MQIWPGPVNKYGNNTDYMAAEFEFLLHRGPQPRSYEIFKCERGYFYHTGKQKILKILKLRKRVQPKALKKLEYCFRM